MYKEGVSNMVSNNNLNSPQGLFFGKGEAPGLVSFFKVFFKDF